MFKINNKHRLYLDKDWKIKMKNTYQGILSFSPKSFANLVSRVIITCYKWIKNHTKLIQDCTQLTANTVFQKNTVKVTTPTKAVIITAGHGQPKKVSPGFHSSGSKEIVCFHREKENTFHKRSPFCTLNLNTTFILCLYLLVNWNTLHPFT